MDHQGNNVAGHRVYMARSVDQIRRDVESGLLDPLMQDPGVKNQNLLHLAVSENKFEIIRYLGTNWRGDWITLVSATDWCGQTPLHIACSAVRPDLKVVEYLLDAFHADTLVSLWSGRGYSESSPLHLAISKNHVQLVEFLVRRAVLGVNPQGFLESRDGCGRTPLLYACRSRCKTDVARYLMLQERPNGLDSHLSQPRDNEGRTALHLACYHNRLDLVMELVKNYSDDVEAQDSRNKRPLHLAVSPAANLSIVRFLVTQAGANVNAKDGQEWTPLRYACDSYRTDRIELIRFLVASGAETESGDKDGKTPLHFASRQAGKLSVVQYFVEETNTAVDLRDNFGNTPLYLACESKNLMIARYLLSQQANANAENIYKERPIQVACNDLQLDFLKELVRDYGADVNVVDRNGLTPLLKMCMGSDNISSRLDCVQLLLEGGADVDVRNEHGETPLILALSNLHYDVAALLVSFGANRLNKDRFHNNALYFARTADMARLLIEGTFPLAIRKGVAYTLLTSKSSLGETPAEIAHKRLMDVPNPSGMALCHYILSFSECQAAVVPSKSLRNKKRKRFEACTQLNPELSPFQKHYVSRTCSLLGHSELGQDLKFHILGFLSPLDLMNE